MNPPDYQSINNDIDNDVDNDIDNDVDNDVDNLDNDVDNLDNYNVSNDRLPSYSSIDLDEMELSISVNKYKLKKNIKHIKLIGYILVVINSIYLIFSVIINSHSHINNNITFVYNNCNNSIGDDDDDSDRNNENIYTRFLYSLFICFCSLNIILSILYYNFDFKYLKLENKINYMNYKIIFNSVYYIKYIIISLYFLILLYNYNNMISTSNINMTGVILLNYFINEIVEKIIILYHRDLLFITY